MNILHLILDAFFPKFCCHCGWIGTLLCRKCYCKIEFDQTIHQLVILQSVQSCTQYNEVSTNIVHTLKYQSVIAVAQLCARMMFLFMKIPVTDLITAVPLHSKRQRARGFNQAEEIAKELSRLLNTPYLPLLVRKKETLNFAKIKDKEQRQLLTEDLFTLNTRYEQHIRGKSILLIDDVWTSGATLLACASKLPTKNIHAITFSHG